jgi:hypothetical protein
MLTGILGALGLGGAGALLFLFPALRTALLLFARRIPPRLWLALAVLALAVLALIGAAVWWHRSAVADARADGFAAGSAARDLAWQGSFDTALAKGLKYKADFEQASQQLAVALRSKTDETLRRNAATADALRLRGPGAAAAPVCRSGSVAATGPAASGPRPPGGPGDAPVDHLPADQGLAILRWTDLVRFAEQHDRYRAEREALIEHHDAQAKALEELRAKLAAALPGFGGN